MTSFSARRRSTAVFGVLALLIGVVLPVLRAGHVDAAPLPGHAITITAPSAPAEGNSSTTNVVFTITLTPPAVTDVTVSYHTADGSARASGDYTARSGTVTFGTGDSSEDVTVAVVGDTFPEPDETFHLVADIDDLSDTPKTATATITNDDAAPTTVSIADSSVAEGDTGTSEMVFTITQSGTNTQDVVLKVTASAATGADTATATTDFTAGTQEVTIPAGQSTATVKIPVVPDEDEEKNETFTVTLSDVGNAAVTDGTATGTINDDDASTLTVADPDPVAEADTTITVEITLATASGMTVDADYATTEGTATDPEDFTHTSGTVTFAPGETEKTVEVPIKHDVLDEVNETFTFTVTGATNATCETAADCVATLEITDNDGAPTLAITDESTTEADTDMVFDVTLSEPSGQAIAIDYTTANGTATTPDDYIVTTNTLTFAIGETAKTITVPIKADTTVEGHETFDVELTPEDPNQVDPCGNTGSTCTGTGTILDDEAATISVNNSSLAEGAPTTTGKMPFTVSLSTALTSQAVNFTWKTVDRTATSTGGATNAADYVAVNNGTGTIAANATSTTIEVTVNGDAFAEPNETFTVELTGADVATLSETNREGTGTITNDDGSPPMVSVSSETVNESAAKVTFTLTRTGTALQDISVLVTTTDGTATAGSDYTAVSQRVTIPVTEADGMVDFDVNLSNDIDDETEEAFTVTLSEPSNAAIGTGTGTATITDNDGPQVTINDVTVAEGDSGTVDAAFNIGLTAPSPEAIDIDYATSDDTTTEDVDYAKHDTTTLTFAPNTNTPKTVTVVVNGDTDDEADEAFQVDLTLPANTVDSDSDNTGVGTITDDDGPTVSIGDAEVADGPEPTGTIPAHFTVTLSAASEQDVTVDYATADGTATAPSDYTAVSSTLTIPAGDDDGVITVTVNNDATDEADEETFKVVLSLPDPDPQRATIADGEGTGTITDDDEPPLVSIGDAGVTENDDDVALATFGVTLSTASGKTVNVDYATEDDDATAGEDYVAQSGTVTFNPGQSTRSITVTVLGDEEVEGDETYFVNLSDPENATIGEATGVGTIENDDSATTPPGGGDDDEEPEQGYWMTATDGGIFSYGASQFFGSMGGKPLNKPMIGMAPTPSGNGYWQVATDGGIFSYGDAQFFGSMGGKPLNKPIVGMASHPSSQGYWLVASDGGIFSYGASKFFGSMGGQPLNKPIVGMAPTPTGNGYWLVASDGGIFSYGDAQFFGSMGGKPLNSPIVGMDSPPDSQGYWLVAEDGGIFTYGAAGFHGSLGGFPLDAPIVGMAATPTGEGYWMAGSDGEIYAGGDAEPLGSMGGEELNQPVVGIAAFPG